MTGQVLTLDEALQDTIPALLSLLDVLPDDSPFRTLDPPQRRQRTLQALKRVLLRESQVQPLLLVFEDLHWIDAETQALLDSLVTACPRPGSCCWSTTGRSTSTAGAARPSTRNCGSTRYRPRVPTHSCRRCLVMIPAWPLAQLLIARTAGNPFFLEESVRTWWRPGCWWANLGRIV